MMHLRSAFSNPAGTVLTVHGYRTSHVGGGPVRTEHREDYVVAGDAHEILKSLLTRQPRGFLRILFAPSFNPLSDLPQSFREIAVTTAEEEIAADAITLTERDFFLTSGFPPNEVFKQLVERKSEERARFAEDRVTEIRADLEAIGTPQQLDSAHDEDSTVPSSAKGEMMELLQAYSNPADTVLTVRGYRTSRASGRRVRTECREDYVVAGDAYEIAKSLTLPLLTVRALIFGVRFDALKLPSRFEKISVTNRDEELAAWEITRTERDFFLDSGIHPNEIFQHLVPWKSAERARRAEERAAEIRANLEWLKRYTGTDAPPHENNAQ